jgi:GNAT superfamily N-acetyltransferase
MKGIQVDDPWSCEFVEAKAKAALRGLIADPSLGCAWLVCDQGREIGYIVLTFDYSLEYGGKCAWVDEFFVKKEYRGKGVGAKTLEFFASEAKKLGAKTIHLEVNHGNPAIGLYKRAGFEEHGRYLMTKWLE